MKLLTNQQNKVTIEPEALQFKVFKKLWERDKKANKEKAMMDLSYVFYYCDFTSVYRDQPEELRSISLKNDIYDNKHNPLEDDDLLEACKFYIDKQNEGSFSLSFLDDALHAANKIKEYFRGITIDDMNGKAVKEIIDGIERSAKLLNGLEMLRDKVKRELQSESRVRGDETKSLFEDAE